MIMADQKTLLLKDYLELDSDSSGSGFHCAPRCSGTGAGATTLRRLLEAELRLCTADCGVGMVAKHVQERPKNTLTKLSAVINAVKLRQFIPSSSSGDGDKRANASPSRIFKVSFWIKKKSEAKRVPEMSFRSPDVSSWRTSSDTTSSGRFDNFLASTDASCEYLDDIAAAICVNKSDVGDVKEDPTLPPLTAVDEFDNTGAGVGARAGKSLDGKIFDGKESEESLHSYGADEEQLSPISIMDFPCEEEDSGNNERFQLISFRDNLEGNIKREKLAELDPVNLQGSFDDVEVGPTVTSFRHVAPSNKAKEELDVMSEAWDLFVQLDVEVAPLGVEGIDKLLLAFFVHGLSCSHEINLGRPVRWRNRITLARASKRVPQELLTIARDWMGGNVEDCMRGTAAIREIEKDGRWRCFEEEEIEIGRYLEGILLENLLEELVVDIYDRSGNNNKNKKNYCSLF